MKLETADLEDTKYSIDLLTRLLIKYKEINKIQLDLSSNSLDLIFLVCERISEEKWKNKKRVLQQKYRLFNKLIGYSNTYLEVSKQSHSEVTTIQLSNQLMNLKAEQIRWMITTVCDDFYILKEEVNINNYYLDDIDNLLEFVKTEKSNEYLAYKEGTKILVFNTTKTT